MVRLKNLKIHHVGLLISDLEKAKEFYGNILGLAEIQRPPYDIQGIWYQLGDSQLHLMLLKDLIKPQCHPKDVTVQPHFSLSISADDYNGIVGKLSFLKIKVIEEKEKFHHLNTEVWQAFFYDFDGNMVEITTIQELH